MTEEKKLEPELRFPGFHEPWEEKKLGEDFKKITSGKTKTNKSLGNYPLYGSTGQIKTILNYDYVGEKILIARVGENTGLVNLVDGKYGVTDNTLILDDYDDININYYYYYLDNYDFRRIIIGSGQPLIIGKDVKKLNIRLPSLQEQEKIGKFFYAIDKKLDLQRERIEELKSYKKGMMQRIFDQEIRFKDEDGRDYPDWEEKKLGDVLIEVNQRNKSLDLEVITSTIDGLYFQSEYFKNRVASKNTKKYKILKKNQIVLSPQNIWMGNINYNDKIKIGIVSPSYKVFETTSEIVGGFVKYFIKTPRMLYNYMISSEQGASVVRRNLNINLFKKINIKLPSLPEQEKIANFLSAIDRWIELEEEKLELYEDFKKGLMQRMFV